jgi:hypothetical protein
LTGQQVEQRAPVAEIAGGHAWGQQVRAGGGMPGLCSPAAPEVPRPVHPRGGPAPQGWCRAIIGRRHGGPIYHDHPCIRRRWASCRARAGGPGQRVRRDAGGCSTISGAILIPAGRRAGGRFPGSAPWRAGRVSHRSRPPSRSSDRPGGWPGGMPGMASPGSYPTGEHPGGSPSGSSPRGAEPLRLMAGRSE